MTELATLRVPGAAQHTRVRASRGPSTDSVMRCRTGTQLPFKMGPASAVHRYTLHRVRDTRFAP
jgi:hypothetical protein